MSRGAIMKIILPSSDLRNKYKEVSKLALEQQKPIYITVNGRGDTVLINQTVYDSQMAELELLRLLAESDEDIRSNNVIDAKVAFNKLKNELK